MIHRIAGTFTAIDLKDVSAIITHPADDPVILFKSGERLELRIGLDQTRDLVLALEASRGQGPSLLVKRSFRDKPIPEGFLQTLSAQPGDLLRIDEIGQCVVYSPSDPGRIKRVLSYAEIKALCL